MFKIFLILIRWITLSCDLFWNGNEFLFSCMQVQVACSSKNIRCNTSGLPRTISNRELLIRWLFQWSFITYNSIYLILAKLNHKHSLFIRDVMSSFPLLSKSRKKCFHHLPLHLVKNDCQFFLRAHSDVCINILPKICLKFFS